MPKDKFYLSVGYPAYSSAAEGVRPLRRSAPAATPEGLLALFNSFQAEAKNADSSIDVEKTVLSIHEDSKHERVLTGQEALDYILEN